MINFLTNKAAKATIAELTTQLQSLGGTPPKVTGFFTSRNAKQRIADLRAAITAQGGTPVATIVPTQKSRLASWAERRAAMKTADAALDLAAGLPVASSVEALSTQPGWKERRAARLAATATSPAPTPQPAPAASPAASQRPAPIGKTGAERVAETRNSESLESLIARHQELDAEIERRQSSSTGGQAPKASATPAKASAAIAPSTKAKTGAPDIMAIGIGVYGERTVQSWAQTHGTDQIEDRICRNLHMSNLGGLIPNFPSAHYEKMLGAPKPVFGSIRTTYADQSAKLQTVLKNS